MHRHTVAVVTWCMLIGAAVVLLREVARERDVPQVAMAAAVTTTTTAPAAPRAKEKREHQYAGNTNTYKFHVRGCRYFSCRNCTAKFATREEAIAAGYRPCGVCDP